MICKNCGAFNEDDARFCIACGHSIKNGDYIPPTEISEAAEPPDLSETPPAGIAAEPEPVRAPMPAPPYMLAPEHREPFYRKLMPWVSAVLALAVIMLMFTTWINTGERILGAMDLTPFGFSTLATAILSVFTNVTWYSITPIMASVVGAVFGFLLTITLLGCAFYIASTIMNRRGAQLLGRIGFDAGIIFSVLAIAATIAITLLYRYYEDTEISILVPTAFQFIALFLSVAGRITAVKSLRRKPYGGALKGVHAGKLLLPVVILFAASWVTAVVAATICGFFGGDETMAFTMAGSAISKFSVPLFILAGAGGLFLIFFGGLFSYKLSAGITLGASTVVGVTTLVFALLNGNAYLGILLSNIDKVYSLAIKCFQIGAIGLLFLPVMPYMTSVWYRRSRWWMHLIVLILLPGATYAFAYLLSEMLGLAAVGISAANVLALALQAAAVLLMVIFGREKIKRAEIQE